MTEYEKIIESVEAVIERVNRIITERQLDEIAHHLAEYGYVKVVRCRDCAFYATDELGDYCTLLDFEDVKSIANGFCAWGERREGAES